MLVVMEPEHFLCTNWKLWEGLGKAKDVPFHKERHASKMNKHELWAPDDLGDFCHDQRWSRRNSERAQ